MAYGTIQADIIQGTNVTLDLSVAGKYEFAGNLIPDVDGTRDLGTSSLKWQNLYADSATVSGVINCEDIIPSGASFSKNLGTSGNQFNFLYVGNIDSFNFTGSSSPIADGTVDLGSNSNRFAEIHAVNVYTGDLHLKNDKGDWTMIEAEDYLTLRNNKTGKTFRLLMEEVDS